MYAGRGGGGGVKKFHTWSGGGGGHKSLTPIWGGGGQTSFWVSNVDLTAPPPYINNEHSLMLPFTGALCGTQWVILRTHTLYLQWIIVQIRFMTTLSV